MKTRIPGDVLLFNGQGTKEHFFDQDTVAELKNHLGDAGSSFELFLQQCLDAFYSECSDLNEKERMVLGCDPSKFYENPEALLFPPESIRSHPVAETISLYIRQILELVVYAAQSKVHPRIVEVTGVCTGLIPAVLAASTLSYESTEFLDSALHGFRLLFWIGLRSASACHDLNGDLAPHSTWVLSTFGWPIDELQTALTDFANDQNQDLKRAIQISAIFDNDIHSLSGPGQILADFKSTRIPSSIQCRSAHVHGFYHGSSRMNSAVAQVLSDVETKGIRFPTWDALHAPLRSPTTGDRMIKGSNSQSLLETILLSIFVEVCDWKRSRENLYEEAFNYLEHDRKARYRLLCVGPGTRSLLQAAPAHNQISVVGTIPEIVEDDTDDMIAIVGMSINYPGANSTEQLWDLLEKAKCTASKIPSSRFDTPAHLSDRYGNFLEDPFQFDSSFFNISPREAKSMDPQHRLLLQAAFEALEDSGYAPNSTPSFQKETFGVFVGVATNDYVDNLRRDIDVYYSPGTLRGFLSGRISYAFDFLGPSIVVDTACSSSLVALYQACQALRSGECTAALAGGVNTITSPDMYNGLARAHFLSPTGQCKPFDAAADGYCRAEGCGLVVVKKLSDAIQENDNIYGVIRGIGVNQCGTAKSITHPDYRTQAALFSRLLSSSRTDPDTISVVEAHGTGTQAGDFAEILSLGNTFGPRSESNPLHVSSIKGNIGHAEAASGMAGVAKLLTMMKRGQIPPQASFKSLNPRLADHIHNMVVPTQLTEWTRSKNHSPRRAMLCNFGAAGSNSALILEEYVPRMKATLGIKAPTPSRSYHVLNLSAKSEKALHLLKERFISYIEAHPDININDLCYTTNARRQAHDGFRLSATGANSTELINSLMKSTVCQPEAVKKSTRKSIFVFSGQGHARRGMGAELLSTVPEFRNIVDKCDKILSENGFPTVAPFLSNSLAPNSEEQAQDEIVVAQCALFVLEFALAQVWIQWGLSPDVVVGHSIGEYAAMAIAGVLDMQDTLLLIARRAQLIAMKCVPGISGMVTCKATIERIQPLLGNNDPRFSALNIACLNSQDDIVVSGPIEPLNIFIENCKASGIKAKQLDVPYGFHSSCMDPILADFESLASNVRVSEAEVIVGSSLRGRLLKPNEILEPNYFVQHTRESVNFCHVIEDIEKAFPDGDLDFIEIGPSPSTKPMIQRIVKTRPYTFLPSLKPKETPWETLSQTMNSLFLRGQPVKWKQVYDGSSAKFLTSLPKYPLNTSRYYVRFEEQLVKEADPGGQPAKPSFEFLGSAEPQLSKDLINFETNIEPLAPYIKAHTVAGVPLCPASVLVEVVMEALSISQGVTSNSVHLLTDMIFESPLVYSEDVGNEKSLQTELDTKFSNKIQFSLSSDDQLHCSGLIARKSLGEVADIFIRKSASVKRQRRTLYQDPEAAFDSLSSKTIYQVIFPRVVAYDKPFLTLKQLSVSDSGLEAYGTMQLDSTLLRNRFVCHPAFIDTLLHAPGFVANMYVPADVACICTSIEHAYLPPAQQLKEGEMTIYCSLTDVGHSVIADAYIIDSEERVVGFIEGSCFKKIPLKSFNNYLSRTLQTSTRKSTLQISTPMLTRKSSPDIKDVTLPPTPPSYIEGFSPMKSLFLDTCGIEIEPGMMDLTLGTLGVDSLLSIELSNELRERFGFLIDDNISDLTFNRLQESFTDNMRTSNDVPESPVAPASTTIPTPKSVTLISPAEDYGLRKTIQRQSHGPQKCNTFLFHDGSGLCNFYSRMSDMNRNITAIFSPDSSARIESLEDLASLYIKRTKLSEEQEVVVGGWSFGGVLAFEAARQLQSLGRTVKGLILIDSPSPVNHQALPQEIVSHIINSKTASKTTYVTESSRQAREKIEQKFQYHATLLENYHPKPKADNFPCVMLKCSLSMDTEKLCNVSYPWVSDDDFRERSVWQWEQLIGRTIPVLDVACNHFEVFDADHVGDVSQKVMLACEMLDTFDIQDNS
ncbi:hypothetical protein O1611_g271 [Lasiodiplodia mahajangana]|uniref:Uncharacterized protein n=1 Tax=Lasiodiplodia mahajangana TaxID=1108764 RepID=A0ACC2K1A5_9PEZI|nr:hypothetical protein O1611_g271 [Lasiodiplodia mahajangana]